MNSDPKKIYFASDQHFGIPDAESSKLREKKFISWLDEVKTDAKAIFLLGDLFDFWFEYKTVIPKGFTRLFGKLAEITDSGIPIHFFRGNHDIWGLNQFTIKKRLRPFQLLSRVFHQRISSCSQLDRKM